MLFTKQFKMICGRSSQFCVLLLLALAFGIVGFTKARIITQMLICEESQALASHALLPRTGLQTDHPNLSNLIPPVLPPPTPLQYAS
jgi:hypothetical protein